MKKIITGIMLPILIISFICLTSCKNRTAANQQVKDEMGESVMIVKIDVDKNQSLAAKYQVRGVPTMLLFKNGKQLWRQSGVVQKDAIVQIVKSHS